MGYSKNKAALERMKNFLDQLATAETSFAWESRNTSMLAYRIRQALHIAEKLRVQPYNELRSKFIIRERGNRVIAELREIEPLQALKLHMERMILDDVVDLLEIIGVVTSNNAEEFCFPNAELTNSELQSLYAWTQENPKNFVILAGENGIVLSQTAPRELAWKPKEL